MKPSCEWPTIVTSGKILRFIGLLVRAVDLHQTWDTRHGINPRFLLIPLLILALNSGGARPIYLARLLRRCCQLDIVSYLLKM